jgi:purine-cytosine permease-like protein
VFVILAVLALPKAHFSNAHGASWEMMMVALALIATSGGLGWPINASDYSRYLPKNSDRKQIVLAVTAGGYVPSVLLALLGAAVATAVPVASDPISGLPHAFASWFLVPYLILIIIQLFAINSIDLYSSGLTLQAIGLKIKRWQAVLVDTVVSGVITAVVIFSASFNTFLTDFLLFMIIWIAPWVGIFLVDYFLRRGSYDSRSLLDTRAGVYWRTGGWHIPGVIAQLLGMVAAAMWLDTTVWQGPLSTATNGADFSIFMGTIVGGLAYYLLARHSVPREVAADPDLETVSVAQGAKPSDLG